MSIQTHFAWQVDRDAAKLGKKSSPNLLLIKFCVDERIYNAGGGGYQIETKEYFAASTLHLMSSEDHVQDIVRQYISRLVSLMDISIDDSNNHMVDDIMSFARRTLGTDGCRACGTMPACQVCTTCGAVPVIVVRVLVETYQSMEEVDVKGLEKLRFRHLCPPSTCSMNCTEEIPMCAICLEKFEFEMDVARLPCLHMYHVECILQWLKKRNCCPLCRYEMPPT
ncbi:uncharacterized protein LOC132301733 [Cornus florida]|uniref:uncharacterized protein LOC132301733 n=1 Tax=Cornus florida TaxID=4283 RepID=UPI00289E4379|nr:uncharacterized protein LOC132301733 [Cornus florida]